ncbi:MAG: hypothetical protein NC911_07640 [Candidatus Omnitrophica bacterium]|nr:hypothetical protein [Candidatus Omnitrophota bacterium]
MDRKTTLAVLLSGTLGMLASAGPMRNILWDGGLETGYGNCFWGTILGNYGPNRRSAWSNGMVKLQQTVASRCYWLEEGNYALGVWVKRAPGFEKEPFVVTVLLTNLNHYKDKGKNEYRKKFPVPEGEGIHRLGWSFSIKEALRPHFHVEISVSTGPGEGLFLDAVSLTPGTELPEKMIPAADIEAGFFIPEETGIYTDGEERIVELLIANHGPEKKTKVHWSVYNFLEQLVKQGTVEEVFPAEKTVKHRVPVSDLPWNGYRLACEVEGSPVLGDALISFLPRIHQDSFPLYGGDAAINYASADFTGRFMRKLGMKNGTTLSCGGLVGRWALVNPEEGKFLWHDQVVEAVRKEGVEVIGFLGLKFPPAWVKTKYMDGNKIVDEAGFTKAYCAYVDAFVRHYQGKIPVIHFEDEIHTAYPVEQLARIYRAAMDTVRQAARDCHLKITSGINATRPEWWAKFIDLVGPEYLDFVSQNTNLRPGWTAQTITILKEKKCFPEYFYTIGVGQKSVLRKTSLVLDQAAGGAPPGLFAWQLMMGAWLSRPYGTEDLKHGPLIRFGYYDLRTLGQAVYVPQAGKTGLEYDNSPTLGLQAMAMQKYWLSGKRPVRDFSEPLSLKGYSTATEPLFVYPFRDEKSAVVILTTAEGTDINSRDFDCRWRLSGFPFHQYPGKDIYGQPLLGETDGSVLVKQLPVIFELPAEKLSEILASFTRLKAERATGSQVTRLEYGNYVVTLNPEETGLLRISSQRNNKEVVIIDRLVGYPSLPAPEIKVNETRTAGSAIITFGPRIVLGVRVSPEGVILQWEHSNNETKPVQQKVCFRVNQVGAGRKIVIQEGEKVVAAQLREDYGQLIPLPAPAGSSLPGNASRVSIEDFAIFALSGATGQGGFSPLTGFRWETQDGEAFLQATYQINPYAGGGSRGVQRIHLEVKITIP